MDKSVNYAVILSGNGVYDGAEIHEATMSLYAIMKQGGNYQCYAPNIEQHHVINHITGDEMPETRNVLTESARIARGNIKDLNEFKADAYDAILFPGGFGVAKNLSNFAFEGANSTVIPEVANSIQEMVKQGKPIGALCISPAIIAKVLEGVTVTIGSDEGTAAAINQMGSTHQITDHGEVVVDQKYKVVTTPCYMLDATILDIAEGAENVIKTINEMIKN